MGVTDLDRRSWTGRNSSRDQERLLVRTVTHAPTIVEKMRRCSGDCQRPEETVTDRERLKMGVTDLNRRSWKGNNSYRLFQRPGETDIYSRYTPTIAEKMRRCSGDCQRPEETVRDRKRLEMGVTDLDGRSWTGRNSYRLFQRPAETVR